MIKNIQRYVWVDIIKAIGLMWIFTNHIAEQLFGSPFIANPSVNWPSMADRISQLRPLEGFGLWNIPVNALRYIGWAGDQGVQLFLIASGFGLTWSLLNRPTGKQLNVSDFYFHRGERIFPLWWGAHIMFIGIWFLTGWGLSFYSPLTFCSLLGIRITPDLLYYFSPAWWYIGLIIQLYIIYPLLWESLRRWGPARLLLWSCIVAFSIRGVGLFTFKEYLDAWSRGAIFITRLPEFVFGISLAAWTFLQSANIQKQLRSPLTWILMVAIYILGTFFSLTLPGMIFAPFCLGVAAFMVLYLLLNKIISVFPNWRFTIWRWVSEHTYSLYLIHHPVILILIPFGVTLSLHTAEKFLFSIIVTLVLALVLERLVGFLVKILCRHMKSIGLFRSLLIAGLLGVTVVAFFISAELLVRRFDPQEVLGWGERPSLEPSSQFGWHLKPSQTTRLRWESYDYLVTANSLGFPSPEYPVFRSPDTIRIMVTGDAFSSAEGVDTNQSWTRLLESELTAKLNGRKVQVLNFSITGYGPNEYEAVIRHFAPIYKPDLILLQMFVNDFQEALSTWQDAQNSIGFNKPEQNSLYSIFHLLQQQRWIQINLQEPIREIINGKPNPEGYFLGNFRALERDHPEYEIVGKEIIAQRLEQIQSIANDVGAKVIVIMVPAPVQICGESQLAYYPKGVDLADSEHFDIDLPQRLMGELTKLFALPFYDLRDPLSEISNTCPYQSHNMHWTTFGHQVVAGYLADTLLVNNIIP